MLFVAGIVVLTDVDFPDEQVRLGLFIDDPRKESFLRMIVADKHDVVIVDEDLDVAIVDQDTFNASDGLVCKEIIRSNGSVRLIVYASRNDQDLMYRCHQHGVGKVVWLNASADEIYNAVMSRDPQGSLHKGKFSLLTSQELAFLHMAACTTSTTREMAELAVSFGRSPADMWRSILEKLDCYTLQDLMHVLMLSDFCRDT